MGRFPNMSILASGHLPNDPELYEEIEKAQLLSRDRILKSTLEWQNFRAAGLIDGEELRLIQLYDHKPIAEKVSLFRDNPSGYVGLFITLIQGKGMNVAAERARYGLSLVEELLEAEPNASQYFLKLDAPFDPFMRLMQIRSDNYCAAKAAKLASLLVIRVSSDTFSGIINNIISWCNEKLRSSNPTEIGVALEGLQTLLRKEQIRTMFADDDGIARLGGILRISNLSSQVIYETLYSLWLLSYNDHIAAQFHKSLVIHRIVDAIKNVQKEKVIRMGLAILSNIANKGDGENNLQMIEAKFQRVLDLLNQKRWADEDLERDLEFLTDLIEKSIREMSSWDAYKAELVSKELEWSPVHTSERFWRENVLKFEESSFEVLGLLVALLDSQNTQVLQVACHDIGEFIRFHPRGREIFSQGSMAPQKYKIMTLMEHPDSAVQKEALLCTQKLLVMSWETLAR